MKNLELKNRTERLSIIVSKNTLEGLSAVAQIYGKSKNDMVNFVVEEFLEKNSATIEKFLEHRKDAQKSLA